MTEYPILNALIFAGLGVAAFAFSFFIVMKMLPFDLRKEIVGERNLAAAVLAGGVALGLGWIIAAVMH